MLSVKATMGTMKKEVKDMRIRVMETEVTMQREDTMATEVTMRGGVHTMTMTTQGQRHWQRQRLRQKAAALAVAMMATHMQARVSGAMRRASQSRNMTHQSQTSMVRLGARTT